MKKYSVTSSPSYLLSLGILWAFTSLNNVILADFPSVSLEYEGKKADWSEWNVQEEALSSTEDWQAWIKTWTAPDEKLQIFVKGKSYQKFPITEYTVWLKNLSDRESTGIVSNFQSLDVSIPVVGEVELRALQGSHCRPEDFSPFQEILSGGKKRVFATPSGRSSNEYAPFLELNTNARNGWLLAVGWTGGWKTEFLHQEESVNVKTGMNRTHFRLLPSETVRQPGILIGERKNLSRHEFQTLLHRFMLDYKVPRDAAGKVIPPILAVASGGGNKTPQMMLDILKYVREKELPFDTYWVDAGWYGAPHEDELYSNCGPNWYRYSGDWRVNTTTHPSGTLLPIANAVHESGMKFLLWFEPERVQEAPIQTEHPEYCHRNLLDLGNPEALRWIQEIVYGIIEKHSIDIYREDFNMDPGGIWKEIDAQNSERVGIAEAKHVAGLYVFLDEMRRRFPNILQENCASGGRRIDVEMISRAHTYCRSDYFIGQKPNDTAFILGQNMTRNTLPFLPFQGCEFNCVPVGDDYGAWSIISSGVVITPSDFDGGILRRPFREEETRWFQKTFGLAARIKPYWSGDFYPLTEETPATNDVWCGWQLDDPETNSGFAIVFRRGKAPDEARTFALGNIDPEALYEVESFDGSIQTRSGKELQSWKATLPQRAFELMIYRKK